MKTMKMPPIRVTWKGKKLKIPGGWELRLPEVTALDRTTTVAYAKFFERTKNLPRKEAEAEVLERFSTLLASNWYRMQTLAIKRWARIYADSFPERCVRMECWKGLTQRECKISMCLG